VTGPEIPEKIGPYKVVRKLGEGGMGAVYEALHEAIGRRVAIKVLLSSFAKDAQFTSRFFNEARAVNVVEHPGLVQISDFGQLPDGAAYLVMELLNGESLARRISAARGPLPVGDVVSLTWQLADSLAAAHAKGIVHRG
jgi:serine/threonine protein kinase